MDNAGLRRRWLRHKSIAARVRAELRKDDELKAVVPSRQTVGEILNRLGYCLRRVQKIRPEKKSPKQTRSSPTSTRRERGLLRNRTR